MAAGRVLLIANPASRSGDGAVIARRVEALLRERLGDGLYALSTTHRGHVEALAAGASEYDLVTVVGGDGSVHEAVNGLMRIPCDSRPALGVIPAGSGNDYAFSLGMSPALQEAVVQLLESPRRWVDAGVCNGRYFAETLSFGLDAAIALDTIERRKVSGASGVSLYMRSGIDQLLHHLDYHKMEAWLDGARRHEEVVLCAVQVGPTYGGGFRICPDARFDDGMLDVCIAHAPVGALKAGIVFLCAKDGRHRRFREIELLRAREIRLRFDLQPPVQIDGDRFDASEYVVSVEPCALRVVAPDDSAFSHRCAGDRAVCATGSLRSG